MQAPTELCCLPLLPGPLQPVCHLTGEGPSEPTPVPSQMLLPKQARAPPSFRNTQTTSNNREFPLQTRSPVTPRSCPSPMEPLCSCLRGPQPRAGRALTEYLSGQGLAPLSPWVPSPPTGLPESVPCGGQALGRTQAPRECLVRERPPQKMESGLAEEGLQVLQNLGAGWSPPSPRAASLRKAGHHAFT